MFNSLGKVVALAMTVDRTEERGYQTKIASGDQEVNFYIDGFYDQFGIDDPYAPLEKIAATELGTSIMHMLLSDMRDAINVSIEAGG